MSAIWLVIIAMIPLCFIIFGLLMQPEIIFKDEKDKVKWNTFFNCLLLLYIGFICCIPVMVLWLEGVI